MNDFSALIFQRMVRELCLILEQILLVKCEVEEAKTSLWGVSKKYLIEYWISNEIIEFIDPIKGRLELKSKIEKLKQVENNGLIEDFKGTIQRICSTNYSESNKWKEMKLTISKNYRFNTDPSIELILMLLPTILRNWSSHRIEVKGVVFKYWLQIINRIFFAIFFTLA